MSAWDVILSAGAMLGSFAAIAWLVWIGASGHAEREEEEAARDFFSAHGHWPDEPPPSGEVEDPAARGEPARDLRGEERS